MSTMLMFGIVLLFVAALAVAYFLASGARRLIVSQRLRSISSVLGGKNSKLTAGLGARGDVIILHKLHFWTYS